MPFLYGISERLDNVYDAVISSLRFFLPNEWASSESKASAQAANDNPSPKLDDGSVIINGIVIPPIVAAQLQQLGLALSWYNAAQLEAAILACSVDCTLIHDPDGIDFFDELELTEHEKEEDDDETEIDPYRMGLLHPGHGNILDDPPFCDRLKKEREKRRRAFFNDEESGDSSGHPH